jgi:hypothetical protein
MHKAQRLINHVALVLDASSSMIDHTNTLIDVADEQIKYLALRSEELSQETRVSVYTFNERVTCQIFDMDVMRLPSIMDLYRANGMTALVDATIKSQDDLGSTSRIYGDHAFLTFVLTDGMENKSRRSWRELPKYLNKAGWAIGFLVPDSQGEAYLTRAGISKGNISIWDTTSVTGIQDSFSTIRTATDTYMTNRSLGKTSTTLFNIGPEVVNKVTVGQLKPVKGYTAYYVDKEGRIDEFVTSRVGHYSQGSAFYQLTKREIIQPTKSILVVDKATGSVYGGPEARHLIGLPDTNIKVSPNHNPDYDIYVQSTSLNRKLKPNTHVLVNSKY